MLALLDGGSRHWGLNMCTLDFAEGLASVWKTHVNGVTLLPAGPFQVCWELYGTGREI